MQARGDVYCCCMGQVVAWDMHVVSPEGSGQQAKLQHEHAKQALSCTWVMPDGQAPYIKLGP